MMRNSVGALLLAVVVCWAAPSQADEGRWAVAGEVAVASTYLWRGLNFHDDRFEPAVQPFGQATWKRLGPGDLTGGLWISVPLREQVATSAEFDPFVRYDAGWGDFGVGLLYWLFLMPDADPVDVGHLMQVDLSYAGWSPATPTIGVSVDPIREDSAYYYGQLHLERSVKAVTLQASVRAAVSHSASEDFGLQDITATGTGILSLNEVWYASIILQAAYGPRMPAGQRFIPAVVVATGFEFDGA